MGARFVARVAPFLGNSEATSKARSEAAVFAAVEERLSGSGEICRLDGVFNVEVVIADMVLFPLC